MNRVFFDCLVSGTEKSLFVRSRQYLTDNFGMIRRRERSAALNERYYCFRIRRYEMVVMSARLFKLITLKNSHKIGAKCYT